jgi:sigma-54 dependent transcriptional regulator, acetoin dehydrogenase operon transcriptional activator AcoR
MGQLASTLQIAEDRRDRSQPPAAHAIYRLLDADHPLEPSTRHLLEGVSEVEITRGEERGVARTVGGGKPRLSIRVSDPRVSRPHAFLRRDGERWIIQDTRSTNGVRINGALHREALLGDGDVIELGHTFLLYRCHREVLADERCDADQPRTTGALATWAPGLAAQFERLEAIARSQIAALLLGPTGTGKELIARTLHARSGRSGPFVPVNCGAIPRELVGSLLFGHRRGAFSGAHADQPGLVVAAAGGTLFLDEVADLPLDLQPALLRVLAEGEALMLGATTPIRVDLRIVAATHQDLEQLCAAGRFREDLLARLGGFVLHLPALAERREDLGMIVSTLIRRLAGASAVRVCFTGDAARALLLHPWERNVRQLELRLASALQIAGDAPITVDHLALDAPRASAPPRSRWLGADLERREQLIRVLARNGGNITASARELGKPRSQLQRWMKKYAIDPRGELPEPADRK